MKFLYSLFALLVVSTNAASLRTSVDEPTASAVSSFFVLVHYHCIFQPLSKKSITNTLDFVVSLALLQEAVERDLVEKDELVELIVEGEGEQRFLRPGRYVYLGDGLCNHCDDDDDVDAYYNQIKCNVGYTQYCR